MGVPHFIAPAGVIPIRMVTLNDLERRNSFYRRLISPDSVAFGADYIKVVEDLSLIHI